MSEKILEVKHLGKAFGSNQVLRDIDFSVSPGDVTCIIGPSGSGKSTLLRCLNMLETPSTGEINYHGTDITSKNVNVPEYRSKVGMVFQNFNLFNNMTALKNCTVGQVKVLKKSKEEAEKKALYYLEKVGMAPYINAKPKQLSGGQKQRVAIARALAMGAGNSSFRRANLRAGSPDGRRGSGGYERPCTRRPDHDHRHP